MSEQKIAKGLKEVWQIRGVGLLIMALASIAAGSYLFSPLTGFLFFRQLAVGRWIRANGEVPFADMWTQAGRDRVWHDGSWLWDLLIAMIERVPFESSFLTLKLLLGIFLCLALANCFSRCSGSLFFGFVISMPVVSGILYRATLDSSLIAYVLTALILLLLSPWFTGQRAGWLGCLLLFLSAILLSNTYEDHLLVLLFISGLLVGSYDRSSRSLPIFLLLSPVFLTPYFGAQALQETASSVSSFFDRLSFNPNPGSLYNFETSFVILVWALALVLVLENRSLKKLKLLRFVFLPLTLSVTALVDVGLAPWALIFSGLVVSISWRIGEESGGNFRTFIVKIRNALAAVDPAPAGFLFFCIVFVNIKKSAQLPIGTDYTPLPADLEDALGELEGASVLHNRELGDYLVYLYSDHNGSVLKKPHLDSRVAVFSRELSKREMKAEGLVDGGVSLYSWLDPKYVLCRTKTPLCKLFIEEPSWNPVENKNPDSNTRHFQGLWTLLSSEGDEVR